MQHAWSHNQIRKVRTPSSSRHFLKTIRMLLSASLLTTSNFLIFWSVKQPSYKTAKINAGRILMQFSKFLDIFCNYIWCYLMILRRDLRSYFPLSFPFIISSLTRAVWYIDSIYTVTYPPLVFIFQVVPFQPSLGHPVIQNNHRNPLPSIGLWETMTFTTTTHPPHPTGMSCSQ